MGARPAAAGKSLTVEQQDELFIFRWLFGLSFKQIDEQLPEWERTILLDRAVAWLPRIIGVEADDDPAPGSDAADMLSLPLGELGISHVVLPAPLPG